MRFEVHDRIICLDDDFKGAATFQDKLRGRGFLIQYQDTEFNASAARQLADRVSENRLLIKTVDRDESSITDISGISADLLFPEGVIGEIASACAMNFVDAASPLIITKDTDESNFTIDLTTKNTDKNEESSSSNHDQLNTSGLEMTQQSLPQWPVPIIRPT